MYHKTYFTKGIKLLVYGAVGFRILQSFFFTFLNVQGVEIKSPRRISLKILLLYQSKLLYQDI